MTSDGELQVGRCFCETGRKRLRVPKSVHIPFEIPQGDFHDLTDGEEDLGADDHSDGGLFIPDEPDAEEEVHDPVHDTPLSAQAPAMGPPPPHIIDMIAALFDPSPEGEGLLELEGLWDDPEILFAGQATPGPMELTQGLVPEMDLLPSNETVPEVDEAPEDGASEGDLPKIATWRLNLTALSQVYNIYMAAYADKIHISRPRSCVTNTLPPKPDLILQPNPSSKALIIGGDLDQAFPHQVNHLIIGDLGEEEIILLAYDDGDVIGYYTRDIETTLLCQERNEETAVPTPFFHENVNRSAWGLAIHKKSRIIAVSSNLHEVNVFVFALSGSVYSPTRNTHPTDLFRTIVKTENGNTPQTSAPDILESIVRLRESNWRIVLRTGRLGTNIPNIAFSNDAIGFADKIVAVDINGRLWLMDIWEFGHHPNRTIDSIQSKHDRDTRFERPRPRGWGVLVLPKSSFLPTKGCRKSLGLSIDEARVIDDDEVGKWVDISQSIHALKNNSMLHPWVRSSNSDRFVVNPLGARWNGSWYDYKHNKCFILRPNLAHTGSDAVMSRPKSKKVLQDGSIIMRTYEIDIELRSSEVDGYGVMFEKVIDQLRPRYTVIPALRMTHERLANLIHVPELSLVVAGSLCGRVALVTLTHTMDTFEVLQEAFKVEAILPTERDEDKKLRPICPLLGVAVSPVAFSGSMESKGKAVSRRRYRIMLHYYDLRILSYEISRNLETDTLSID